MKKITLLLTIQFFLQTSYGQNCAENEQISTEWIEYLLNELASERFQGRYPGTVGDSLATHFIVDNLKELGLTPMGENSSYLQRFTIKLQANISENTYIKAGRDRIRPGEQIYPTRFSANTKVRGKILKPSFALENEKLTVLNPSSLKRKIAIIDMFEIKNMIEQQGLDARRIKLSDILQTLIANNVKGVLFTSSRLSGVPIPERYFETLEPTSVPVWYASHDVASALQKSKRIRIQTYMSENQVTTNNIAGFWEVGSNKTIVIGAHYDHLGMGDKNSAHRGKPELHPGADDNASGVAGVLALTKYLVEHGNRNFNYLILFFGAEEQGLLGSKHWVMNPTYPLENITAMFNHDMIGRLGDDRKLRINGTGTSPEWEKILSKNRCYNLSYQFSKGGRGPSDHTSFYNQNIPVLHFFTGLHQDYHKPSDIAARINIEGIRDIIALNATIINELANLNEPLQFTPTDFEQESRPVRLNVTMGIMPGYNSDNKGLEVEGVTKGKPAEKAGIVKGDLILRIGDYPIRNIRDYMEALAQYELGDTAPVQIMRAEKILEISVIFE